MPATPPKILFLAAHVQPFLLAGIRSLVKNYNAKVLVVYYKPSPDTSGQLIDHPGVQFIFKEFMPAKAMTDFNPDIVWVAGWMDKDYLSWARKFKAQGRSTIMAMDTQWFGTFRQHINVLLSPFRLKRIYTHAWVPGYAQKLYAMKLGFSGKYLLEHLLTPDTDIFNSIYQQTFEQKKGDYPKAFLYLGRLEPHKFGNLLLAFTKLSEQETANWKLVTVGSGSMETHDAMKDARIQHHGFMQQERLVDVFQQAGVFCLTSSIEPWGTVVQEAAAAGMPLIVSRQSGASFAMVRDNDNGFLCNGESITDIQDKLKKMIALPSPELVKMGEKSHKFGMSTTPDMWAKELMSVFRR